MKNKILTEEEKQKIGAEKAHIRLFMGTDANLVDVEGDTSDIVKLLAGTMDGNESFLEIIKAAMKQYKLMQNPLYRLFALATEAEICQCEKCVARREKAERAAKEN
jgi:hypothetical protein